MPYEPFDYTPSWVEWSIFAAAISLFILLIAVFVKVFPIMAVFEMVEERELQAGIEHEPEESEPEPAGGVQ